MTERPVTGERVNDPDVLAVYMEAKRLVDSLDEEKVLRAGCWAGVDLQPLCDLLDGPSPADFSAALEMLGWRQIHG